MVEKNLGAKKEEISLKIRMNFKALNIRNTKDVEFLEMSCEPNMTVNNLIRKAITMLYKRFDKKLKIERSNDQIYILKESDKDNYFIGEDQLKQYTCFVSNLKRRRVLIVEIKVVFKSQLIDGYYPYSKDNKLESVNPKFLDRMMKRRRTKKSNKLSSSRRTYRSGRSKSPRESSRNQESELFTDEEEEMDMKTKEKLVKVRNPLIWYFPMNFNKSEGKRDIIRDIFDKSKRTAGIRKEIAFQIYDHGALVKGAIKSADVKAPFCIKFH